MYLKLLILTLSFIIFIILIINNSKDIINYTTKQFKIF